MPHHAWNQQIWPSLRFKSRDEIQPMPTTPSRSSHEIRLEVATESRKDLVEVSSSPLELRRRSHRLVGLSSASSSSTDLTPLDLHLFASDPSNQFQRHFVVAVAAPRRVWGSPLPGPSREQERGRRERVWEWSV